MLIRFFVFVLIFCMNSLIKAQDSNSYTICAHRKHFDDCKQLERSGKIKCKEVVNEASCLLLIDSGIVNFGSISPESAFLASELAPNVKVVARVLPETGDQFDYETVIVTNKRVESFADLKGFSYCHPGRNSTDIPPALLKEFELKLLKETGVTCREDSVTVTEEYYRALSDFFGPSCIPGRWTQDDDLDAALKRKYSRLLELCNSSAYDGSGTPLEKSFNCLFSTDDVVAFTTLSYTAEANNTFYLCKNGSSTSDQCIWSQQPFRLLVANKNEENIPQELKTWYNEKVVAMTPFNQVAMINLEPSEIQHLQNILFEDKNDQFIVIDDSLQNYTKSLRDLPTKDTARFCKGSMRWCTVTAEEQTKCAWLSQASLNYGVAPVVECVQRSTKVSCINAIRNEDADIVMVDADLGFTAMINNLSAIAFPETESSQELRTLLIVKEEFSRLENLKGKRGCFSQYGDIAWVSFIDIARGIVMPTDSCDYGKLVSDFVGESCMPGARDTKRAISNSVNVDKVCQICIRRLVVDSTCAADMDNKYYGNDGALKCLEETGHFAVLTVDGNTTLPEGTIVMCRNGTVANHKGLNVDDACYLSILTTSEIVTRRKDGRNKDIELALLEFDYWFASRTNVPFRLFDSFNETLDLLFKDSTPGLDLPSSNKKAIRSYVEVFKHANECARGTDPASGNSSAVFVSFMLTVVAFILTNYL